LKTTVGSNGSYPVAKSHQDHQGLQSEQLRLRTSLTTCI